MIASVIRDESGADSGRVTRVLNPVLAGAFSRPKLGNSDGILLVSPSWRDVLDLKGDLLWAGCPRLDRGLDSLHDLHVRLDGQMIGKRITRRIDVMRRMVDRGISDGCKASLNWPSTCPSVPNHLIRASQFPVTSSHQYRRYLSQAEQLTVGRRTWQE